MRDARSGGGHKRVTVKARKPDPALNHRQQQIVHNARVIVQSPRGSKQHRRAAQALAKLNLNDQEHELAARAAKQHREHLDQIQAQQRARRGPSLEAISRPRGRNVTELMPFALPGLSHELHYHEPPHPSVGHNADLGDLMLRQAGIYHALKQTQVSPVLRGLRTATQDIIGPSIVHVAHGEHASKTGVLTDVAMLADPTKVGRGATAALEALRAGERGLEVVRAAKAASKSRDAAALVKFRRTKAGKQVASDFKAHPVRAEIHAQIEAHPELKPAQKRALKQNIDAEVHDAARQSGKTIDEIFSDPRVAQRVAELRMTPEEIVANRIRPRNPGHEGLAPTGVAHPELRAAVSHALETHGVDTSVFRKADIDPIKFADLIARGEPGRFWYEQSGKDILAAAHGNRELADKMAQLLAVYSAQRAPVENTQLAVKAFHEWQQTGRVSSVGTGPQIAKANQILVEGKPWEGLKTDRFYGNLLEEIDPEKYARMFPGGEVTNDIWMARLFGLKTDNPTTREYHAMTGIVQRVADELGWKPKQVQAALWVAKKAEYEGTSVEQAAIDFSTALRAETAHLPFEAAPGAEYAPVLYEQYAKLSPEAQRAYTAAKADLINQFLDDAGVFGRLGHEGVGVYEGQINPGWTVYVPAARGTGPEFNLLVSPHARAELDGVAAAIGRAFHQDAAAWFKPFYKKSVSTTNRNGAKAILDRGMREEEAVALEERFRLAGHDIAIVHDHDGVHFLNLDPESLPNRQFHNAVGEAIDEIFGPETRTLTYASDGNYITKEGYDAALGGNAGGRSDVLRAAADRLEERGAAVDAQFLSERGAGGAGPRLRIGGDGLSSGINPGFDDNTERGLLGDWFAHLRGKTKEEPVNPDEAPPPTPEELASEKVLKGLKGSKDQPSAARVQREEASLQSSERGVRAGLAQEAMAGVQGLEAKLAAAKAELEGALPKLEYGGIRSLSESELDRVSELIEHHPDLRFYESLRGMDALRNAWLGVVPTPSELKLLRTALGPKVSKEMFKPSRLQQYKHGAYEVLNMPRSLMASFDVSAPFRQGLVSFAAHPLMTAKNLGPMMKYLGSEHGYQDLMRAIDARPNRDLYAKAGLAITDVESALGQREEQFMSNLAEHVTGFGKKDEFGHYKYSPVRASGRAYTGFLVKTRADMFDLLLEKAEQAGHDIEDPKLLKDLGNFVNAATGRGSLGKLEGAAVVLNSTFFSPRLMASRLTFLWPPSYVGLHPFVRQQKLRAAWRLATAVGATLYLAHLGGAKVGLDPFNADFGKMKFGDTRVDVSGGFAGYVRMIGVLSEAATGHDPDRKATDAIVRFFRGKLGPVPGTLVDAATHTDYSGYRSPKWRQEISQLFIPLVVQDTMKVVQNKDSIPKVAATAAASAVGFGVNTYKDNPATKSGPSRAQKEDEFTKKYKAKFGRPLPAPVQQAQQTKEMYAAAEKRRKDELGVSKLTEEQRAYVKLAVLGSTRPDLRPAIRNFRRMLDQGANAEATSFVNGWVEDSLNWPMLEQFHSILKEAG